MYIVRDKLINLQAILYHILRDIYFITCNNIFIASFKLSFASWSYTINYLFSIWWMGVSIVLELSWQRKNNLTKRLFCVLYIVS